MTLLCGTHEGLSAAEFAAVLSEPCNNIPRHATHTCSVQNHLSGMSIVPWEQFVADAQAGQRTGMRLPVTLPHRQIVRDCTGQTPNAGLSVLRAIWSAMLCVKPCGFLTGSVLNSDIGTAPCQSCASLAFCSVMLRHLQVQARSARCTTIWPCRSRCYTRWPRATFFITTSSLATGAPLCCEATALHDGATHYKRPFRNTATQPVLIYSATKSLDLQRVIAQFMGTFLSTS